MAKPENSQIVRIKICTRDNGPKCVYMALCPLFAAGSSAECHHTFAEPITNAKRIPHTHTHVHQYAVP